MSVPVIFSDDLERISVISFVPFYLERPNSAAVTTTEVLLFSIRMLMACKFRLPKVKTMECLGLKITDGSRYRAVLLLVVYRPGSQAVTDEFFDELQLVLTSIQSTAHEAVIATLMSMLTFQRTVWPSS